MKTKIVLIIVWLFFNGASAFTQSKNDTIKTVNLLEVIVTGNIKTDPTLTIVKDDYTDKPTQPKSSGELFSDINGFSLIKRGNYAVDPSFRATQYEQLNVQIDGGTKAMHACPNRMDPITTLVNPEVVNKIEIIKGPFSVRYGPTFGGVINLVTKNTHSRTETFNGTVSTGYESNGNSIVNIIQLMGRIKKMDWVANFSHRNYGNYKDGDGNEIPSSFKSLGYDFKLGYNFSNNQRLQANFRQNFGRDVLHAGLPMDTKIDNSSIAGIDYTYLSGNSYFRGISIKGYYSFVDHIMNNFNRSSFNTSEAVANVNASTLGGKIETEWDLGKKVKLFAGTDFSNLSREGNRARLVKRNMMGQLLPTPQKFTDKIWQNAYNNQLGIFAEGKYFISDKDIFTYGARFDHIYSHAKDIDPSFSTLYPNLNEMKENNFSGTIAYRRKLNETNSIEMAFGRGFRTANMEERYIAFFNIGRDAYEYIGNPYLKPEVNNQVEISISGKEKMKGIFNLFTYNVSVFYSFYENYIMGVVDSSLIRKYNPTSTPKHPKVFRNIKNAIKTGFEFSGYVKFATHFEFITDLSYVYTNNKEINESLPLTPPFITRLKIGYEKNLVWANIRYNITSSQNRISKAFDEITTKGYEVMDVEAGVKPFKNLKIGVGVLNLFNKQYNNHLTFAFNTITGFGRVPITEPGRNFTVFASYTF